jgi:hypothetical protein
MRLFIEALETRCVPSDLGALLVATPKAAGLQILYYQGGIVIQQDGYQSALVQGNTPTVIAPITPPPVTPLPDAVIAFIAQWQKEDSSYGTGG